MNPAVLASGVPDWRGCGLVLSDASDTDELDLGVPFAKYASWERSKVCDPPNWDKTVVLSVAVFKLRLEVCCICHQLTRPIEA